MSDPAKYRTREEVQQVRSQKDPINHVRDLLLSQNMADEQELKNIDSKIKKIVNESAEVARNGSEPHESELWTDVYANA